LSAETEAAAAVVKVRENFEKIAEQVAPPTDVQVTVPIDQTEIVKDLEVSLRSGKLQGAADAERDRLWLEQFLLGVLARYNANSKDGYVLELAEVSWQTDLITTRVRNLEHFVGYCDRLSLNDGAYYRFSFQRKYGWCLVAVRVSAAKMGMKTIEFGAADCMIKAIAKSLKKSEASIDACFKSLFTVEVYKTCVTGNGFDLLHLDSFGKRYNVKAIILVNQQDLLIWGEFPTVVGDLQSSRVFTLHWRPGHWSSNEGTLRESSPVPPVGAGVSTFCGFMGHEEFVKQFGYSPSANPSVRSPDGVYYRPCVYTNGFSADFNDHIDFFTGPVLEPVVAERYDVEESRVPEAYENLPMDSYRLASSIFPSTDVLPLFPAANTVESQLVFDNFRTGVLNPDVICNVNMRGHVTSAKGFYSIGASTALYYEKSNNMQTLQVLSERYANKHIRQFTYTKDAEDVANSIADKFCFDCFQGDNLPFDFQELNAIMVECEAAMRVKHYEAQTSEDSPDARSVRFHLKDISKPKVAGDLNVYKAGQGISAWSKTAQSWFGKAMRILNARFGAILKSNIIYDNRMTEEELISTVNDQLRSLHKLARRGVTDCDQFDSVQNRFTQAIERRVLKKLGASDSFLDAYYSFRQNYVLQSQYVRARCGFEKTSGEPGTLLLNTILSMVLTFFLFEGEGKMVIVAKGDDGFRAQLNLKVKEENLLLVNKFCQLGLKLSFDESVEFCGNIIVGGCFYPSIFRKLAKIVAHRFRNYEHFCEYQISLRDWESKVACGDMHNLCAVNAVVYGSTLTEAHAALACVRSFAHINEAQFKETFLYRLPVQGHFAASSGTLMKFVEY